MKQLAPIALFTYNRFNHTQRTIQALLKNKLAKQSVLYVFSDGAKNYKDDEEVKQIRNYLKTISDFKAIHIICNEHNKGLANSIIEGISFILKKFETVIVLEDDLKTSPYFLNFMNDALNHYSPDKIWSIAGYTPNIKIPYTYKYNTYLAHRNCSWGWATWKLNWEKTDWDMSNFNHFFLQKENRSKFERGGNDLSIMLLKQKQKLLHSWSIRFNFEAYNYNLPTVYPIQSLVNNFGVDGSGTHMKQSNKFNSCLLLNKLSFDNFCPDDLFNKSIQLNFKRFYNTSIYRKGINLFKTIKALKSIKKPN